MQQVPLTLSVHDGSWTVQQLAGWAETAVPRMVVAVLRLKHVADADVRPLAEAVEVQF